MHMNVQSLMLFLSTIDTLRLKRKALFFEFVKIYLTRRAVFNFFLKQDMGVSFNV